MASWFLLPHLAAVRIEGPDALAFAHAQFTTSFQKNGIRSWCLTAWCDPRGRVLNLIVARSNESHVDLVVPALQVQELVKRLRLYAIGRKIAIQHCASVAGNLCPGKDDETLAFDPGRSMALNQQAPQDSEPMVLSWREADIRAGVAWLGAASSGQYLPQALGLEDRGGLSYRKGCYPGQEIIARVHYLGKIKERLMGFVQFEGPDSGTDELEDQHGNRVGRILESVAASGRQIGLAVVAADLDPGSMVRRSGHLVSLLPPETL